ncbi:MAG: hypothetical protein WCL29_04835 [Pseudomonadota bacterium]
MNYWLVADHLCRHCGIGRVLVSAEPAAQSIAKCSSCGKTGATVKSLCFCGHTYTKTGDGSGMRCVRNIDRKATPHEIVVEVVIADVGDPPQKIKKDLNREW